MKAAFFLFCMCVVFTANSQPTKKSLYSTELGLVVDNDNLFFNLYDGYYTNGIFLKLNKAAQTRKQKKKIISYELGQLIFTPGSRRISYYSEIDRAYAGYFFYVMAKRFFLQSRF